MGRMLQARARQAKGGARRRWARGASLAALALMLAGCSTILGATKFDNPPGVAEPVSRADAFALPSSVDDPEHARILAAYGGIYDDPGAARAVARAVGRVVAASDDPSQTYRITILNTPVINAFALPNGNLYVSRGLLALANDSSELAAVIAHEMAHVTARHAAARARRNEAAQTVGRVVANVVSDPDQQKMTLASTQVSLARFSQVQELEADAIGVRTLSRAGYDPYASARFLTSMQRFSEFRAARAGKPDFLSSHPTTPERITFAVRAAREIGAPGIGDQDREAYIARLEGMTYGDDPSEGFVRGRSYVHRQLGIALSVPAGWSLENSPKAVLGSDAEGSAFRFDSVNVPEGTDLGAYLGSGWLNGLDPASVRTTTVNAWPAATGTASADGWNFRIGLVRVGKTTYRFFFATQSPASALEKVFDETIASFRTITAEEGQRLRPLRLGIHRVKAGETIETIAARMAVGDRKSELFQVLNGLEAGAELSVGQAVKLVVE